MLWEENKMTKEKSQKSSWIIDNPIAAYVKKNIGIIIAIMVV